MFSAASNGRNVVTSPQSRHFSSVVSAYDGSSPDPEPSGLKERKIYSMSALTRAGDWYTRLNDTFKVINVTKIQTRC